MRVRGSKSLLLTPPSNKYCVFKKWPLLSKGPTRLVLRPPETDQIQVIMMTSFLRSRKTEKICGQNYPYNNDVIFTVSGAASASLVDPFRHRIPATFSQNISVTLVTLDEVANNQVPGSIYVISIIIMKYYSSLLNKRNAWNKSNGVPTMPKLISVMHGIRVMVYRPRQN